MNMKIVGALLLFGLTGCTETNARVTTHLNTDATLTGTLPADPFGWRVITSAIDHRDSTMYTVFGNDPAVQYARTNAKHDYPVGAIVSLVTWSQQEDPRWFGGRIPAAPKSVEFVTVRSGGVFAYEKYEGNPLKKTSAQEESSPTGRAAYLIAQRAAVMP
jgi:hypothetical protein